MFGLRSARSRAIAAGALGLLLLASVVAVAGWRAHDDQQRHERLEHRSAVVAALEDARAQTAFAATWVATSTFAEDAAPLHDLYRQAILGSREAVDEARTELIAIDAREELPPVEGLGSQMDELTQELDALWAFALTADRDARVETAQRDMGRLWPLAMGVIGSLERLSTEHQSKLAADVEAADRASDTTLWLLIGLGGAAFVIGVGTIAGVIVWTVRPLAALRASARAIADGDAGARANVSGPEEVASLARDFNAMADTLSAKAKEYIDTTNLTGVIILRVDKDNRVSFVNDVMCEFLGRSREEILGTPILDYLHPDDAPSTIQAILKMVRSKGLVTGIVSRHVTPTGTRVTEWNGYPIFDEQGRYAGVHGTGRDITERKRAEEALRQAEQRYRGLFEGAPVMYVITRNENGAPTIADCNELFASTLGYARAEVLERPLADFYTPESRADLLEGGGYERALESRFVAEERQLLARDGGVVGTLLRALPETAPDGHVSGTRAMYVDITERKRAEDALRESEGRFRTLSEATFEGIAIHEKGKILDANQTFAEMFGYELSELIGMDSLELAAPESRGLLRQSILSRSQEPFEAMALRKDGTAFLVEIRGRPARYREQAVGLTAVRDITERKRAEQALRESEGRYRLLAENATDVIWTMDTNLRITYVSPSVTRLRGYTVEEVMGQTLKQMVTSASLKVVKKAIAAEQAIEKMEEKDLTRSRTVEVEQTCKDGSTVWVEAKFAILRDPDDQPIGTLGITRDISERKWAEEALVAKAQEYVDTTNLTGDIIVRVDRDGRLTFLNDAACEFYGRSREELLGAEHADYVHPDDLASIAQLIREGIPGRELVRGFVNRMITPMGTRVVEWNGYGLFDEEGHYVGLQGTGRDITERKQAEEALRESEEKYRRLVQDSLDGIVVTQGLDMRLVNPALLEMFGCEREEEMVGRPFTEFISPEYRELLVQRGYAREKGQDEPERYEYKALRKDGSEFHAEISVTRITYQGKAARHGIIRDVTERKRAEEALRESEERFSRLSGATFEGLVIHERGKILDANPAFARMFGYELFEVIGMHALDFTAPQSRDLLWQGILSRLKEPFEALGLRKDGSTLVCELRGKDIPYQERMVTVVAIWDITERKRADEALRKAREDIESRVERRVQEVNGYNLTFRELTVLHLVAAGQADKEIATVLGISPFTAHKHLANILDKMGAASRTEAGVRALREGLLD